MANAAFQVIVSAVDRSSPALAAIKRQLEGLSNEVMRVQVRTARLAAFPATRMRRAIAGLTGGFATIGRRIGGVWSGRTSLMPPLAALGAGTSLGGIFELVRHVAEARHELTRMAETIGIVPTQMARLNFAARMSGTNVESMQVGLTKLNKVMGDTARGKNKDLAALFRQIGISTQELATGNAATVLPKIAASFRATHSATMRAAMAQALFGRGWREMVPLLLSAPEEMRAWIGQLDRLGYKFTEVDDKNLTTFRRSWVGLETAAGGFTNMLGARLAPVLTPIVNQFTDWLTVNRDWIATGITDALRDFTTWLNQQDWRGLARDAGLFATVVADLVGKLGGVRGVVEIIVGYKLATWAWAAAAGFDALAVSARALAALRLGTLGLPLLLGGDTANNEQSSEAEKATRGGQQQEWLRDNPNLSTRVWRWLWPPPTGMPTEGGGDGTASGDSPRGSAGGVFPGPQLVPPPGTRPGGIGPLQIFPNLYAPSAAPAMPEVQGAVDVNVRFVNAPAGMQIDTQSTGQVRAPRPEVGYAFGFERLGYA